MTEPMPPLEVGDWVYIPSWIDVLTVEKVDVELFGFTHAGLAEERRIVYAEPIEDIWEIRKADGRIWRRE